MSNGQQGVIHSASEGGVSGRHPEAAPFQFLVAPSTSNEFNTARLRLIPVACWKVEDIRFAFDSSFVTPDIKRELQDLLALREAHKKADIVARTTQFPPLSVFGHADPVGLDDYNKALSGRRATVIYALLISNTNPAKAVHLWKAVAAQENWGTNQRQTMQSVTGLPAGTPEAQLFQAYMQALCPKELSLTPKDFLAQGVDAGGKGDYQGCSSFNPVLIFSQQKEDEFEQAERDQDKSGLDARNAANAPNRRVMVLLFRVGSKVDPAKWPCPRATEGVGACIKRFWSDGQERRRKRLPDQDRKVKDTEDTFACRFYQRISRGSPCEQPISFVTLTIRLLDDNHKPMSGASYVLQIGGLRFAGKTDARGELSQRIPASATSGRLILDMWTADLSIQLLGPIDSGVGLRSRLQNLGYFAEDTDLGESSQSGSLSMALMRFQSVCDEQQRDLQHSDGNMDEPTKDRLNKVYGT
jgi:hypothetical protein